MKAAVRGQGWGRKLMWLSSEFTEREQRGDAEDTATHGEDLDR
jgi:hypothetical protein